MSGRWQLGAADIEQLLHEGSLELVTGAQSDGHQWLQRAHRVLASAELITHDDPESSYVLGYDAARHACVGLLAQQGIRATSKGGHYAVEKAVRSQFGPVFRPFGTLRRRRNELEYPSYPGERVEASELAQALADSRELLAACAKLMDQVGLF